MLIKIKDHDPLNVSATRLTADSSVFSHQIDDLGLTEIEIEDFEPEIVILFLTLLEDRKLDQIEDSHFRELHKISTVFKVRWLVKDCRNWLFHKIMELPIPTDYQLLQYLFEECFFIAKIWKVKWPMNLLISKRIAADNRSFIMRYIFGAPMNTMKLYFLLKLAGTDHSIFIDIINADLDCKRSLSNSLKFLLVNINSSQQHNIEKYKYERIYQKIARLPDVTTDEIRLTVDLLIGS